MRPLALILLVVAACILGPVALVVAAVRLLGLMLAAVWRAARALVREPRPAPVSTSLTDAELGSSAPIVYFVHGTFASGARWTASDALVATAIARDLATLGLAPVFQRLEWSGANTVAARCAAITELQTRLSGIFGANPQRRVFLIGHSHGGSVAIKAAEPFSDRAGLGIVTLATPFIIAQVRADAADLDARMRMLVFLCLAVPCALAASLMSWPWLVPPTAAAIALGVLAVRAILLRRTTPDGPTAALLRSVPDLVAVQALTSKTLIVSRSGDEADGVLKLASFLNGWIAQTLRESDLSGEAKGMLAEARRAGETRAANAASAGPARLGLPTVRESLALASYANRMSRLGPEVVGVLAGTLLLQLLRVAVGTTSGLLATTVVVTSSETPPGEWRHVQTLASSAPTGTVMSHSQIYDDQDVCDRVAEWVKQRA